MLLANQFAFEQCIGDGSRDLADGCTARTASTSPMMDWLPVICYDGYFLNILTTALSTIFMFFCELLVFKVFCAMPRHANSLAFTS